MLNNASGINYRSVDTDDVILNICGFVIGWSVYATFNKICIYLSEKQILKQK